MRATVEYQSQTRLYVLLLLLLVTLAVGWGLAEDPHLVGRVFMWLALPVVAFWALQRWIRTAVDGPDRSWVATALFFAITAKLVLVIFMWVFPSPLLAGGDSLFYLFQARETADSFLQGDPAAAVDISTFRWLGYVLWITPFYFLSGGDELFLLVVQSGLDVLAAIFVFSMLSQRFGPMAGRVGLVLMLAYPGFTYWAGLPLKENLITFQVVAVAYLATRLDEAPVTQRKRHFIAYGIGLLWLLFTRLAVGVAAGGLTLLFLLGSRRFRGAARNSLAVLVLVGLLLPVMITLTDRLFPQEETENPQEIPLFGPRDIDSVTTAAISSPVQFGKRLVRGGVIDGFLSPMHWSDWSLYRFPDFLLRLGSVARWLALPAMLAGAWYLGSRKEVPLLTLLLGFVAMGLMVGALRPIHIERYNAAMWPFAVMLAAIGFAKFRNWRSVMPAYIALLVLLAIWRDVTGGTTFVRWLVYAGVASFGSWWLWGLVTRRIRVLRGG